jgi:hypothetical protein
MKKILLFGFSFLLLSVMLEAQSRVSSVSTDGAISGPAYVYLFGSSTDTCTNVDTVTFTLRVKGDVQQDFSQQLYIDHVSGTAGGVLTAYASIDGVAYDSTLGTITVSGVTADAMDTEVLHFDSYLFPYVKYQFISSGTAVTVPKLFLYTKEN